MGRAEPGWGLRRAFASKKKWRGRLDARSDQTPRPRGSVLPWAYFVDHFEPMNPRLPVLARRARARISASLWLLCEKVCRRSKPAISFALLLATLGISLCLLNNALLVAFGSPAAARDPLAHGFGLYFFMACAFVLIVACSFALVWSMAKAPKALASLEASSLAKGQHALARAKALAERDEITRDCPPGKSSSRSPRL